MTMRPNSIVTALIYDEKQAPRDRRARLDAETGEQLEFYANVIFLCASTLNSAPGSC